MREWNTCYGIPTAVSTPYLETEGNHHLDKGTTLVI